MKTSWLIPIVMLLMVTAFTNCSPYTQTDQSSIDALGDLSCPATSNKCVTPSYENLAINVNLPMNSNQILLTAATDFNLGGDCNEGGYPANVISWELYDGGTRLRDSSSLGLNSTCVNGRFLLYFTLGPVSTDNVNRTGGVDASGAKRSYSLVYRLRAVSSTGYVDNPNASRTISLLPRSN